MALDDKNFSLEEVLAVAKRHPFYDPSVQYPPHKDAIRAIREQVAAQPSASGLSSQPLLWKSSLYKAIQRLVDDTSTQNTFRRGIYASSTGGGSSPEPLFFATDVAENRQHRLAFGRFLGTAGLVTDRDWVVTIHPEGELCRSLDLIMEILENGGGSVLAAGHFMLPEAVINLIIKYHANVLAGDSSQIVNMVHYISSLPNSERGKFKLDKVIYTSESLTSRQRAEIHRVLGADLMICSLLGSAEAGPYAFSFPSLTGKNQSGDGTAAYEDFVFDTRLTIMEILPATVDENDEDQTPSPIPDGEKGVIAQTSLVRLRNPLVRYITGDVGSLHDLPEQAQDFIPQSAWPHLKVLRLYGRDRRFSFEWAGSYFEFSTLNTLMNNEIRGILQWQVILENMEESPLETRLEFRILLVRDGCDSAEKISDRIKKFCCVDASIERTFRILFVNDVGDFVRSPGARKVINFVDRQG
ncbi:unnamed protein product [Clonostachys solani]|uniref:AMP-dependent synthetase/ligase domain-containing protein n=1 Tax=Clonostachys solani TaxID=160281 RepID=A0A9N9Z7G0_9HYPO|nr:unnamed protein product [Clonostachys solani]